MEENLDIKTTEKPSATHRKMVYSNPEVDFSLVPHSDIIQLTTFSNYTMHKEFFFSLPHLESKFGDEKS